MDQNTIDKLRKLYNESTNELAKQSAKKKLEDAGVSLTESAKSEGSKMDQNTIDKLRKLYNESTNDLAKQSAKKKLEDAGVSLSESEGKSEPKAKAKKPKAEPKPKSEPKAKAESKSTAKDDYDCDDLIKKEKERKAKAKANAIKRANAPKKTPTTKNKEAVQKTASKVEKSVETRAKKGQVKVAELEKLISEYEQAIKRLKALLTKVKSGKKFAQGGNMGMMDTEHANEYHEIKEHTCGCKDKKMEHGGGVGGEQITKVAKAIFNANEKNGKIKISTKASQTLGGLKYLIADSNSEYIASAIFEANENNGKIKTELGEKTYGQLLALISHAKENRLSSVDLMAKGGQLPKEGKLVLQSYSVDIYEDDYNEGEGKMVNDYNERLNKEFDNGKDLLDYIKNSVVYSDDAHFHIDEEGYLYGNVLVDSENTGASKMQIERWKKGDEKLYSANYRFIITIVQEETLSQEELSEILGVDMYAKGGEIKSAIDVDKHYRALPKGKRTSEKVALIDIRGGGTFTRRNANQYGRTKGGNTYYEYHDNRSDKRKNGWLEKGGEVGDSSPYWVLYGIGKKRKPAYIVMFNDNMTSRQYEIKEEADKKANELNKSYKKTTYRDGN